MLYLISVVRQSDSVIHILSQYGLSQDVESSSLCYTVGPCCLSILHVIVCILFLLFSLSVVSDSVTPCTPPRQASLSFTVTQSLLKLMSIESVMISNHLILCCPYSFCLQSFPASGSFPISQLFTSGGRSVGASASVFLMNIQGWLPLGLTGLILSKLF